MTNGFLCLKRFYNTGPPAYSDTSYSDILATVTGLAILKLGIFVNKTPLLGATIWMQ